MTRTTNTSQEKSSKGTPLAEINWIDTRILLNDWIQQNINELRKICNSISRQNNIDDLLQVCIEQLLKSKRIHEVPETERLFFFARIVRNNFNSKTSKFHKIYRKNNFVELSSNIDIPIDDYEEPVLSIEWVLEEVDKIKQYDWYLGQIFLLWLSRGANLTQLSKATGIPINNLSRDIRQVKNILNKQYKEKLQ